MLYTFISTISLNSSYTHTHTHRFIILFYIFKQYECMSVFFWTTPHTHSYFSYIKLFDINLNGKKYSKRKKCRLFNRLFQFVTNFYYFTNERCDCGSEWGVPSFWLLKYIWWCIYILVLSNVMCPMWLMLYVYRYRYCPL